MNSRERIRTIISGNKADRCGFWLGNPDYDSWKMYYEYFGTGSQEEIRQSLHDDIRWIGPQFLRSNYKHVQNMDMFYASTRKAFHGQKGPFAGCEDVKEVEAFKWPDAGELIFDETLAFRFKGRITFMGGIDTQDLLVNGTPDDVADEVVRVKELLGPCLIVSPSHEALLPNVSPENVAAMARAAISQ